MISGAQVQITKQPAAVVQVPFGENAVLCCEAVSASNSDLYYQWYEQVIGDEQPGPVDTGPVLRLNNVQRECQVYCMVTDDLGYQASSHVCRLKGKPGHCYLLPF